MLDEKKYTSLNFFNVLLNLNPITKDKNIEFIFVVYRNCVHNIMLILKSNQITSTDMINPLAILRYIVSEYEYSLINLEKDKIDTLHQNKEVIINTCNIVVDKYLTLEHFFFKMEKTNNKFYPPLSSIDLYTNHILHILNNRKKLSPPETLMDDMFYKFFSMVHCIVNLLSNGYETEALSTWRTIHETDCILMILYKHPETIPTYLRHITYNLAFRNTIPNQEEQDAIFVELKSKMKERNLKSKDMKRYIEVGWIYTIKDLDKDENVKLNFRNGIEYVAGLEEENEWYEMSSEIAHSSPLLIYSNNQFFFNMTLIALYKSFLNIEEVFTNVYTSNCDEKQKRQYLTTRELRLPEIRRIFEIEHKKFEELSE